MISGVMFLPLLLFGKTLCRFDVKLTFEQHGFELHWWISFHCICTTVLDLPGGSGIKNLSASAGDVGLIPESGRSLGEGNGNPLQYSCLGNPTDRGAWWATVHGVAKELDTT